MPASQPVRIFVSYSHANDAAVQRLQRDLEQAGAMIWIDHESLIPGMPDWEDAVRDGIAQASFVVYAASPDARKSPYVRDEINLARLRKREVIPFWVAGDDWLDCAPLGWGTTQYSDGRDASYAAGLQKLLRRLGLDVQQVPSDAHPPAAPSGATPAYMAAQTPTINQAHAHDEATRTASASDSSSSIAAASTDRNPFSHPTGSNRTDSDPTGFSDFFEALFGRRPTQESRRPAQPLPKENTIPPGRFPARFLTLGFIPQSSGGVEWIVPPTCHAPSGQFRLGSDKRHDPSARPDELNRRTVDLSAFEIARFPVTVAEYACFLADTRTQSRRPEPPDWATQRQRLDHPIVSVSWYDAFDYAVWLTQRTNQPWRLPTEAEWEKAARCDPRDPLGASSQRIYPWGDRFEARRCNIVESGQGGTTPIGWYGPDDPDPRAGRQSGVSPYGVEDLAGNVSVWTATAYAADYSECEAMERYNSTNNRCTRGGSWGVGVALARAACRNGVRPGLHNLLVGFRLAFTPVAGEAGE